jgi:putative DNA methylase
MVQPFSLKDAPALIEVALPVQKLSAEAQKERKAGAGQTLTALGSYWKGRKPLILAKACILGCLLPATVNTAKDIEIFEKLMGIDDAAFAIRANLKADTIVRTIPLDDIDPLKVFRFNRPKGEEPTQFPYRDELDENLSLYGSLKASWKPKVPKATKVQLQKRTLKKLKLSYMQKLDISARPEEVGDELYDGIWRDVNKHLGTEAHSIPELVEQLGIMRFGHRPKVADTFCGGGSIPFEAARLGCDVYASDLNPVACMLTWAALNILGADGETRKQIAEAQKQAVNAVDAEITALGIEHNSQGDRAKAYLYCVEAYIKETGWKIPMAPTWVISVNQRAYAKLVPDYEQKRFDIEVVTDATAEEMEQAKKGTVREGNLVYQLDDTEYVIPIRTLRGDRKVGTETTNDLRRWDKLDFIPRSDDIFQERLYCIQWLKAETLDKYRPETYFASVTEEDLKREAKIEEIVWKNLEEWQEKGLIPDMEIESGEKTDEPIRTRGWTYWHHLFTPRQLVILSLIHKALDLAPEYLAFTELLNYSSRLCRWETTGKRVAKDGSGKQTGGASDNPKDVFTNQALNTLYNFANRSFYFLKNSINQDYKSHESCILRGEVVPNPAAKIAEQNDLYITDPPYGDAIYYHEITEFFTSWIRKKPPKEFSDWVWDTRRVLAINGDSRDFRQRMAAAYSAMSAHMPSNGMQVIMFTHQGVEVWADMAAILWGAGLQVVQAWYIATETTSELKKGGYVQGTVLMIARKRQQSEQIYKDELVIEIRQEVERQINIMLDLNQEAKRQELYDNLFTDADLYMAGYAAALKVLTSYTHIGSTDMTQAALRPRQAGQDSFVDEMVELARNIAGQILVPEGLYSNDPENAAKLWEKLAGSDRFYLKMLDLEATGIHKLDNYQNFAKAFKVDYAPLMGNQKPNAARLKSALEFKKAEVAGFEFERSILRSILYALYQLQTEVETDLVLDQFWDNCRGKFNPRDREDIHHLCNYIALKLKDIRPEEASAARVFAGLLKTEHL